MSLVLNVAARRSPLSQAQVQEIWELLKSFCQVDFSITLLDAPGDLDLLTPLTDLSKTDFFTKTIDEMLIENKADIAIHSAKDLPENLPDALEVIALTHGVDPRDVLISFKYTLETLPLGATIGACSQRRIQGIKKYRPDVTILPIRGSIDQRIKKLEEGDFDAIILAQAGLLRLQLDVPREFLDIEVAPMQGQLAIVACKNRSDLKELFSKLDSRICG